MLRVRAADKRSLYCSSRGVVGGWEGGRVGREREGKDPWRREDLSGSSSPGEDGCWTSTGLT